ncbi:hypothetical protein Dimus_028071 [Dionaea muscipula]
MTLEDFFSCTKMNCGPISPVLVEELGALLQKAKDCFIKNADDATQQWSSLVRSIAATENKDCLDLFIKLDGLRFLGLWLKGVLTIAADDSDYFLEELIAKVLLVFEKLQIDEEKLLSSGILVAVNSLLGHNSSVVQQRARTLVDSWKQTKDGDAVQSGLLKTSMACEGRLEVRDDPVGAGITCAVESSLSILDNGLHFSQSSGLNVSAAAPSVQLESIQNPANQISSLIISDNGNAGEMSSNMPGSTVKLNSDMGILGGTLEVRSFQEGEPEDLEAKPDCFHSEYSADGIRHMDERENFAVGPDKVGISASQSFDYSNAETEDTQESLVKPAGETSAGDNDSSFKTEKEDFDVLQNSKSTSERKSLGKHEDSHGAESERMLEKHDDVETSSSRKDDVNMNMFRECRRSDQEHFASACRYVASTGGTSALINEVSDMDLEYCTVDALEIARLVANEVEREVGDYDEQSGSSSSERIIRDTTGQQGCLNIMNGKQDYPSEGSIQDLPTESLSAGASPKEDDQGLSSVDGDLGQEHFVQNMDASLVTEAAQETAIHSVKGLSGFDLNQEVCSEEDQLDVSSDDDQVEICFENDQVAIGAIANAVAVTSSEAAAAATGICGGLLQSEGRLRWKESAATSTFQPASPSRKSDVGGTPSVVGTSNGSRHRLHSDIDLNVAEGEGDEIVELATEYQDMRSPGVCNEKHSGELNCAKTDVLNFDLNQASDGMDDVSHWRLDVRLSGIQNFPRDLSPISLSSPMKASANDFNLNDSPANFGDPSEQQNFLGETSTHKANADSVVLSEDPDIVIMGARVRKKMPAGSSLFSPFGRSGQFLSSAAEAPDMHSFVYGYNGFASSPGSFSPTIYGQSSMIPLVDSRGAAVAQPIISPTPMVPPPYPQSSSVMNNAGGYMPSSHISAAAALGSSLSLNSGFLINGVTQDSGVQQFFTPGVGRPLEGQMTNNFLYSFGGKRKEQDGGFEAYSANYRTRKLPHL